jgi:hypothetical protein
MTMLMMATAVANIGRGDQCEAGQAVNVRQREAGVGVSHARSAQTF